MQKHVPSKSAIYWAMKWSDLLRVKSEFPIDLAWALPNNKKFLRRH